MIIVLHLHRAGRDQSGMMLPEIKLHGDVDVAALSPLLRGMLLSVAYADGEGGIGLTATGAMNRKFVHWAAVHFLWPDFTAVDLYSMNKVLNESDMPPLWVVRDMTRHLKLLRRKKNVLLPTKRGREFLMIISIPMSMTPKGRRRSKLGYVGGACSSIFSTSRRERAARHCRL
jgi:hypothetical protein